MVDTREDEYDAVVAANIKVHSFLAESGEYNRSPHFRPENKAKVRNLLETLVANQNQPNYAPTGIDFGCGTGFIIDLVKDLLSEVHGVDVTTSMMDQIDLSSGNVYLHMSHAESTPFPDGAFDFAFAYSFMDHLSNYENFLSEAFRVLKPGGVLYSDLNPNREFFLSVQAQERRADESSFLAREVEGALRNGQLYNRNHGISAKLIDQAEPVKSRELGFDVDEVKNVAQRIGFSRVEAQYDWFLGEGVLLNDWEPGESATVERYLREITPVSSHLFKYLRFFFWR